MSQAVPPLGFDPRKLRQIRSYGNDTVAPAVAIAPAARSFAALLIAIGVPDDDLDGVKDLMMQMETNGDLGVPTDFKSIASQCREVYARYKAGDRLTITASDQETIDGV
jgi:hypothetical protein